ncbi:hypothetical protein Tco_0975577 [Tanacetum coccineum]|uniref:Uncharacterized protein n=1 Tax=Tanacetum coccineum TaxID=301880 RepID=A0ABQ5EES8_9ASTR
METIQAFLKEYDHIPPKCMALLLAEERFLKIKQVMEEEQNQPEVLQELLLKLMNDLQILKGILPKQEEPVVQSFTPYGNFSMIDDVEVLMKDIYTFVRKFSRIPFGVTPKVLSIAWERFGEIKHALTDKQYRQEDIQELMSKLLEDVRNINEELSEYINYEIIKSSVEILVPIPSESKGISDDTCDVPVGKDSSTFDALNNNSEILSDSNNDGTLSDDDDFEDIGYVSLEEVNDVDQEKEEIDLEDILQIQDVILREKLLNVHRLIANIKALNDNPSPDRVLKSPSLFPIPIKPDQGRLTSVVIFDNSNDPLLELPEFESFHFDPSFPRPPPEPPDVEICLNFEPDTPVINIFDELNEDECFDLGGGEINVSQNVEDDDSFTFVIRTFLPFLTYPVGSPLLLSTRSEDTIFDPGIST